MTRTIGSAAIASEVSPCAGDRMSHLAKAVTEVVKLSTDHPDSRPMRPKMVVPLLAVIGLLGAACAPQEESAEPGQVDAFAAVELASPTPATVIVPVEQINSCVDSTKHGAFVGEAEAAERWNTADQTEVALIEACTQIGRTDPASLAAMHWNWTAAQAAITAPPPPIAAPANDCDPSYPDVCIPAGVADIDCGDITQVNFTVLPPDRHGFDGNFDGVGCEE
jgi:hypothetical protein